jgi:hypothetical protein
MAGTIRQKLPPVAHVEVPALPAFDQSGIHVT